MTFQLQSFDQALSEYQRARNAAGALRSPISDDEAEAITDWLDIALDRLLRTESPSFLALRTKLGILASEYGSDDRQPRHVKTLLADAAIRAN